MAKTYKRQRNEESVAKKNKIQSYDRKEKKYEKKIQNEIKNYYNK